MEIHVFVIQVFNNSFSTFDSSKLCDFLELCMSLHFDEKVLSTTQNKMYAKAAPAQHGTGFYEGQMHIKTPNKALRLLECQYPDKALLYKSPGCHAL
jgi:hypothetical protein